MYTEAWLVSLRENLSEVERDTQEAYLHRRELVKLLVEKSPQTATKTAGRR
jgi:hypothetical protein